MMWHAFNASAEVGRRCLPPLAARRRSRLLAHLRKGGYWGLRRCSYPAGPRSSRQSWCERRGSARLPTTCGGLSSSSGVQGYSAGRDSAQCGSRRGANEGSLLARCDWSRGASSAPFFDISTRHTTLSRQDGRARDARRRRSGRLARLGCAAVPEAQPGRHEEVCTIRHSRASQRWRCRCGSTPIVGTSQQRQHLQPPRPSHWTRRLWPGCPGQPDQAGQLSVAGGAAVRSMPPLPPRCAARVALPLLPSCPHTPAPGFIADTSCLPCRSCSTAAASGSSGSLTGLGGAGSRPATGGASAGRAGAAFPGPAARRLCLSAVNACVQAVATASRARVWTRPTANRRLQPTSTTPTHAPSHPSRAGSGSASAFDNLLGGLGPAGRGGTSMRASSAAPSPSKPPPAAPAAAAATAKPPMPPAAAPAFTPSPPPAAAFAAMPEPQGPPPAADEDPFALFGGPPPPAAAASGPSFGGSTTVAIPVASVDDGFLDAFAASPLPAPQQAVQASASASRQQVAAAAAAAAAAVDDADHFGDFKASEDSEVPRSQATAPAPAPRQAAGTAGGSSSFSGRPGAPAGGPTSTFGFERQPAGGAPRYRVFDFVEGEADGASAAGAAPAGAAGTARPGSRSSSLGSGQAADPHHFREQGAAASASAGPALPRTGPLGSGAPAGGGGGGVLHAGRYGQQQQAGTKEVVTDLGHKAAKALQTGTKWFMRASKTLVSQVQQKLEHPHGGPQGRASTAQPGGWVGGRPLEAGRAGQEGPQGGGTEAEGRWGGGCRLHGGCVFFVFFARRNLPPCRPGKLLTAPLPCPPFRFAGGPLPYHYDWAAQLSRASPGSRATALEAMAEEDRLAVQVGAVRVQGCVRSNSATRAQADRSCRHALRLSPLLAPAPP